MITLEQEFAGYKMAHIVAILKAKMIRYYEVVLANTVQLPTFMGGDTPEKCADRDIEELYNRDINEFYRLYELAYQELAENGEF